MHIIEDIAARHDYWTALRRDLHAHPELGFEEHRTAGIVVNELQRMGVAVHQGLSGTGVVGTLSRGDGPTMGLRADMDALPMEEENTFDYRSQHAGKAHACGHDGHTVMLLAAAEYLAKQPGWRGTIHFIFQPAEEVAGGAKAMLDDGLFEQFPVDAVFGMHNWPQLDVGGFAMRTGPMLASMDTFDIAIAGQGAHGAMPHQGIDPVTASAAVINALQTIVSRNTDPLQTAVVSITQIHAGDAYNIIPEQALLGGGIRCFDPELRHYLKQRLVEVAQSTAEAHGATATVTYNSAYPPIVNAAAETALAAQAAAAVVGQDAVNADADLILGSEDFSYMLEQKPGCYVMLGTGPGDYMIHNPGYDFNDAAIPVGASYWVRLAESFLRFGTPDNA